MSSVPEISPLELHHLLKNGPHPKLLDVREPEEHKLVKLRGSVLIPMMSIADRLDEIRELSNNGAELVVVYCRSGKRSAIAIEWLASQGLTNLKNLRGGINAYGNEADKRITPY
ncbi:MAG: rhodanese-like domain-containing protein [Bdellovibrionota bacterium]